MEETCIWFAWGKTLLKTTFLAWFDVCSSCSLAKGACYQLISVLQIEPNAETILPSSLAGTLNSINQTQANTCHHSVIYTEVIRTLEEHLLSNCETAINMINNRCEPLNQTHDILNISEYFRFHTESRHVFHCHPLGCWDLRPILCSLGCHRHRRQGLQRGSLGKHPRRVLFWAPTSRWKQMKPTKENSSP